MSSPAQHSVSQPEERSPQLPLQLNDLLPFIEAPHDLYIPAHDQAPHAPLEPNPDSGWREPSMVLRRAVDSVLSVDQEELENDLDSLRSDGGYSFDLIGHLLLDLLEQQYNDCTPTTIALAIDLLGSSEIEDEQTTERLLKIYLRGMTHVEGTVRFSALRAATSVNEHPVELLPNAIDILNTASDPDEELMAAVLFRQQRPVDAQVAEFRAVACEILTDPKRSCWVKRQCLDATYSVSPSYRVLHCICDFIVAECERCDPIPPEFIPEEGPTIEFSLRSHALNQLQSLASWGYDLSSIFLRLNTAARFGKSEEVVVGALTAIALLVRYHRELILPWQRAYEFLSGDKNPRIAAAANTLLARLQASSPASEN